VTLGRVRRIGAMEHGAAVEALRLIPDPAGQNRQMTRPLASVHDVSMTPHLRKAALKHGVNILTELGLAGHLYKIVGVQADETLFDHVGVFPGLEGDAVWWPVTGSTFFRAVRVRGGAVFFRAISAMTGSPRPGMGNCPLSGGRARMTRPFSSLT